MKSLESFPSERARAMPQDGGISREDYERARVSVTARLSPVQLRMIEVLSDGKLHKPDELHECLEDELGPLKNITPHLANIRKVLRALGEDIASVRFSGNTYYQKRKLNLDEE